MATPNNVTPTNCSWWPISALENDAGKSTEGEENQDPTDPALKSQDRLVLYHWTQSFSSQKVKKIIARPGSQGGITSSPQGIPFVGRTRGSSPGLARAAACGQAALLYLQFCILTASAWGGNGGGAQPKPAFALGSWREPPWLCAPSQPHSAWPGVQTKAEPGPGTTLPPGEGAAAPEPGSFQGADPGTQQRFTPDIAVAPWKSNSWGAPARNHIFQAIVNAHFAAQQPYSKPNLLLPAPNPSSFPHR